MQDWSEIGPTLTKKLLEENPDQELEALRAAKNMGDIWQQIAELTDSTLANAAFMSQLEKEQAAIQQSLQIQEDRHKKKHAKNNKYSLSQKESE